MHELGIVTYVAKSVDAIAEENHISNISAVILEIGEVSGIVPEYLVDCWNYFKRQHPVLKESELKYETLEAITYCENCGKEYPTVAYGRTCPYCKSDKTYLLRGRECNIKELIVLEEEQEQDEDGCM